jgi:creatinine amidohydrolase/Fe(II)-dependent formamide hydrolase-like protein
MLLHHSSWPEIEAYLEKSKGIVIPIGSTEQHGPSGLIGTDAICPEAIASRAGAQAGFLVGPPSMSASPSTTSPFPAR